MVRSILFIVALILHPSDAFAPPMKPSSERRGGFQTLPATMRNNREVSASSASPARAIQSAILGLTLAFNALVPTTLFAPEPAYAATEPSQIVGCLVKKCPIPLGKCILNPKCLANVACINTCNNRPDEIECQIKCGDLFENAIVGEFNKCAVSDMSCVPQKPDDGSYPVPPPSIVVPKFDTNFFEGRWYISAGQNELFDIFPCQVHFFSKTGPNQFVGKLNWRIEEPDGEFFTRDALQAFKQDPEQPGHLINHDNEYLHYKDDWWVIDYEPDNNGGPNKDPPFAFIYYRGSNDAWDGYGGVVVYTRDAKLPTQLLPRLREAAKKINYDFDKDFVVTDNSCPTEQKESERLVLREKFAGKILTTTEKQLQAQTVRVRGNAANSIKAQKIYFENGAEATGKAFELLDQKTKEFEKELSNGVDAIGEGASKLKEEVSSGVEAIGEGAAKLKDEILEPISK
ncbi:hypothetical protein MPSEU_000412700 [Mayamaea pseudoterrestris]|nr:hypothetical protein MPSEU_000412700 [Mayamaea pseudoterrestris]